MTHPNISGILDYWADRSRGSVVPVELRRFLSPHRVPLGKKERLSDGRRDYPLPRLLPPVFFKNRVTNQFGISVGAALDDPALRDMADLDQVVQISDKQFVVFEVDVCTLFLAFLIFQMLIGSV